MKITTEIKDVIRKLIREELQRNPEEEKLKKLCEQLLNAEPGYFDGVPDWDAYESVQHVASLGFYKFAADYFCKKVKDKI